MQFHLVRSFSQLAASSVKSLAYDARSFELLNYSRCLNNLPDCVRNRALSADILNHLKTFLLKNFSASKLCKLIDEFNEFNLFFN